MIEYDPDETEFFRDWLFEKKASTCRVSGEVTYSPPWTNLNGRIEPAESYSEFVLSDSDHTVRFSFSDEPEALEFIDVLTCYLNQFKNTVRSAAAKAKKANKKK